jgi:FdhD protein
MAIAPERFAVLQKRRRNMTGRTGFGPCGVDDLTQVARPLPRVGKGVNAGIEAIHRALRALPAWQPANQETGAVHLPHGQPLRAKSSSPAKMSAATTPSTS